MQNLSRQQLEQNRSLQHGQIDGQQEQFVEQKSGQQLEMVGSNLERPCLQDVGQQVFKMEESILSCT